MKSKKYGNDATAIFINQMLPTKSGRYTSNITYCDTVEGLHTEDQALMIRRLYEEFDCDYIAIDSTGIGLGVFDALVRDINDPERGEIYPALSCCNNPDMASRCTVPGAPKVIWALKGSPGLNSECAYLLREGFRTGRVRLLVTEEDGIAALSELKGFNSLSAMDKARVEAPYIHTTLLINELVRLQHEETNGKVRLFERPGMRKDRYSSLSYSYYVATQIEAKQNKRHGATMDSKNSFVYRAPKSRRERW